jgi:hypothetical protein
VADSLEVAFAKLAKRLELKLRAVAGAQAIGSSQFLKSLGEFATELIRKRTQLGYGVKKEGGAKTPLAPLTRKYRERRSKFAGLSSITRPNKSNLTLTGEMFERIGYKIKGTGAGAAITVGFHGPHYSGLSAQELADIHHGGKRPFMYFTDVELKRLVQFYRRAFRDALKQF